MLKVAIVAPELVTGGAETMVVRLATAIDKNKYEVLFICVGECKNSILDNKLKEDNIRVIYMEKEVNTRVCYRLTEFLISLNQI